MMISLRPEFFPRWQILENKYGTKQNPAYSLACDHTENIGGRRGKQILGFLEPEQ